MNKHYNQNYTREQIENILCQIKECIKAGNFTIALNENRIENIQFMNEYNINSDTQKSILSQIKVTDFCHSLQNTKPGYEHETLYVFVPQVTLYNISGKKEKLSIYTKFNIINLVSGKLTVVISFHKPNKPIVYSFK